MLNIYKTHPAMTMVSNLLKELLKKGPTPSAYIRMIISRMNMPRNRNSAYTAHAQNNEIMYIRFLYVK